ncbi:uncharacterized protein BT62DRAFT_1081455 [Guyanagaster necrorhizus]|uniref:F-box domain-containing protein n=1 Tax=Guyanagaster necrorhizus TaxID=856835 RepID=A0A9P7VFJ4_9AGAR|nr:uncharacterized protein BT62DRAFT_1081455 [Guyanagaster necrorhizus MCA 3950]KAG7439643.1 hypothetical protein BT62DRAFT_1081455 [Guyanagaster necrorhizus MCA 3950]
MSSSPTANAALEARVYAAKGYVKATTKGGKSGSAYGVGELVDKRVGLTLDGGPLTLIRVYLFTCIKAHETNVVNLLNGCEESPDILNPENSSEFWHYEGCVDKWARDLPLRLHNIEEGHPWGSDSGSSRAKLRTARAADGRAFALFIFDFHVAGSDKSENATEFFGLIAPFYDCCPSMPFTESVLCSGLSSIDVDQATVAEDIANLETELRLIEPLFIQIGDRRVKLLQYPSSCKALQLPIQRLPQETLLEIFERTCPTDISSSTSPWILGHVCSSWQSISRSSSSLWTSIGIDGSEIPNVNFLSLYLSLSHDLPLNIRCTHHNALPTALTLVEEARLVGLFRRSNCNLTKLYLYIPYTVDTFLVPIFVQSRGLQYLDITIDIQVASDIFRSLSPEAGNVPNLKDLHIEEVPFRKAPIGLLQESAAFHAMILPRWRKFMGLERLRLSLCSYFVRENSSGKTLSFPLSVSPDFVIYSG